MTATHVLDPEVAAAPVGAVRRPDRRDPGRLLPRPRSGCRVRHVDAHRPRRARRSAGTGARAPADGCDGVLPCVYSIHGGGYVIGTNTDGRSASSRRCARTLGFVGVSVEYRLAPETPYPGPLEDCYRGLRWTYEHAGELGIDPNCIGVMGVSAGGGLAAALAPARRDRGEVPIAFQLLDQPMLDDRQVTPSSRQDGLAVWSRESNTFGWRSYLGDLYGADDVPADRGTGARTDLAGLPARVRVGRCGRRLPRRGRRLRAAPEPGGRAHRAARVPGRVPRLQRPRARRRAYAAEPAQHEGLAGEAAAAGLRGALVRGRLRGGRRPSRTASSTSSITQRHAADRLLGVEIPLADESFVVVDRPQRVEHRRRERAICTAASAACRPRRPRAARRAAAGSSRRASGRAAGRGSIGYADTKRRTRAATSAMSPRRMCSRSTPGFLLEALHHRVAQRALVGEVAVHGALVHAGPLGDRADRERAPVTDRRAAQQLGARGDDALRVSCRALAAQCAVVATSRAPARRSWQPTGERLEAANRRGRCDAGAVEVDVPLGKAAEQLVERDPAFEAGRAPHPRQKWMP